MLPCVLGPESEIRNMLNCELAVSAERSSTPVTLVLS